MTKSFLSTGDREQILVTLLAKLENSITGIRFRIPYGMEYELAKREKYLFTRYLTQ